VLKATEAEAGSERAERPTDESAGWGQINTVVVREEEERRPHGLWPSERHGGKEALLLFFYFQCCGVFAPNLQ